MKRLITGLALIAALNGCKGESENNLEKFFDAVPRMQKEYGCIGVGSYQGQPFSIDFRYARDQAGVNFLEKCMKKPLTEEQKDELGVASKLALANRANSLVFDASAVGFVGVITFKYDPSSKK